MLVCPEQVDDYFNNGVLTQAFQAERHLMIWRTIADEVPFLQTLDKETQRLYVFIQESASTGFILHTSKLFDKPSSRNPTRCITSFLQLVAKESPSFGKIEEIYSVQSFLEEYDCPKALYDAVESEDLSLFPKLFSGYYLRRLEDEQVKNMVNQVKAIRDKTIAHNEQTSLTTTFNLDLQIIDELLKFSLEIIAIFGMAYYSYIWKSGPMSLITSSAERNSFFVRNAILKLKAEQQ